MSKQTKPEQTSMNTDKSTTSVLKAQPSLNDLFSDGSVNKESFDSDFEPFMVDIQANSKDYDGMKNYIHSEIKRVVELGKSPLKALYQNLIHVNHVGSRQVINALEEAGISHVWLALTSEAASGQCPERDPHGALINPDYRGKVLVAKIGNAGGKITGQETKDGSVTSKYTGNGRKFLMSSRKAYELEVVTGEPKRFPLSKAMIILAQWGFGIREKRMIKLDVGVSQDAWLVCECKIEETYADFLENKELSMVTI